MAIRFIDPKTKMKIEVDTVEEYNAIMEHDHVVKHDKNFIDFMKSIGVTTIDDCERPVLSGNCIQFKSQNSNTVISQRMEFEEWINRYDKNYWYVHRIASICNIQPSIMDRIRNNIKKFNVIIDEE